MIDRTGPEVGFRACERGDVFSMKSGMQLLEKPAIPRQNAGRFRSDQYASCAERKYGSEPACASVDGADLLEPAAIEFEQPLAGARDPKPRSGCHSHHCSGRQFQPRAILRDQNAVRIKGQNSGWTTQIEAAVEAGGVGELRWGADRLKASG